MKWSHFPALFSFYSISKKCINAHEVVWLPELTWCHRKWRHQTESGWFFLGCVLISSRCCVVLQGVFYHGLMTSLPVTSRQIRSPYYFMRNDTFYTNTIERKKRGKMTSLHVPSLPVTWLPRHQTESGWFFLGCVLISSRCCVVLQGVFYHVCVLTVVFRGSQEPVSFTW
jgi:hypothetical protein